MWQLIIWYYLWHFETVLEYLRAFGNNRDYLLSLPIYGKYSSISMILKMCRKCKYFLLLWSWNIDLKNLSCFQISYIDFNIWSELNDKKIVTDIIVAQISIHPSGGWNLIVCFLLKSTKIPKNCQIFKHFLLRTWNAKHSWHYFFIHISLRLSGAFCIWWS